MNGAVVKYKVSIHIYCVGILTLQRFEYSLVKKFNKEEKTK